MESPHEIMKVDVGDRWIIYVLLEPNEIDRVDFHKKPVEFVQIKRRSKLKRKHSSKLLYQKFESPVGLKKR